MLGFFAGFSITALVVIMQSPAAFHVSIGILSADVYFRSSRRRSLSWPASESSAPGHDGSHRGLAPVGGRLDRFAYARFLIALFSLVSVLPLLLPPFTALGAAVFLVAEVILLAISFGDWRLAGCAHDARNRKTLMR